MSYQINDVCLKSYGAIGNFQCSHFSNINLIIGENGTGKTYFLKALYSMVRSLEEYKRGDDVKSLNDVLSEKLRWTFQIDKLGDMVTRSSMDSLVFDIRIGNIKAYYQFSQNTTNKVKNVTEPAIGKNGNSIFIPAKEVLSLFSIILKSREVDRVFGFDDTYYDLAKALRIAPSKGKNFSAFSNSRKIVSDVINGSVNYDEESGKWYYKNKKNQKFSIGATSEGVKKIAIMDRLLANGYLNPNSIIFIADIGAAVPPAAGGE
ncbi:MAG: ATP-binding protein [Clostridiales bacterium]|nr:ATP-binding protein [Clostridiales bacterium]